MIILKSSDSGTKYLFIPFSERPIKVSIGIPIVFLIICAFLVFMPLYVEPVQVGMGILITVIGVPVYLVGVHWRNKPQWFNEFMRKSS